MRLFTLALPLAAALVLVAPAIAGRPSATTTTKFGTPVFVSTPSADGIHRDVTLTVPFTHQGTVGIRLTITVNGVAHYLGTAATYRGSGSDTFRWLVPGTDSCWPPLPGDTVSYRLELFSVLNSTVSDRITTPTYTVT